MEGSNGDDGIVPPGKLAWTMRLMWVAHIASFWANDGIPVYLTIDAGFGLLVVIFPFLLFIASLPLALANLILLATRRIGLEEGIFGASSGIFFLVVNAGLLWVLVTS